MKMLKWWMRIVGVVYLLLGVYTLPILGMISTQVVHTIPGAQALTDTALFKFLVDTWFMFGLEMGVIGVGLLIASRNPARHTILVWTVLGLEAVRGIADDIYMLASGYPVGEMLFWIIFHTIIIVWGLVALRRGETTEESPQIQLQQT